MLFNESPLANMQQVREGDGGGSKVNIQQN